MPARCTHRCWRVWPGATWPRWPDAVGEHAAGEGATFGGDRAFPVDPVPRLIAGDEWRALEEGLGQRVRALDAFVSDLARERRVVQAGIVPERLAATLPFLEPDLADLPDPGERADRDRRPGRRARHRRALPRARGQRAHPVGHGLPAGHPPRDQGAPGLRRAAPPGTRRAGQPARSCAVGRAARPRLRRGGRRPVRRPRQLRLLRAPRPGRAGRRAAGASRRTCASMRGRLVVAPQRAPGRRPLPAHQRGPPARPGRHADRDRRAPARAAAGRHAERRQRLRHRRRRRQADLSLRGCDDWLLPPRGAAGAVDRDVRPGRVRRTRRGAGASGRARAQAARRPRRPRGADRARGVRAGAARGGRDGARRPRGLERPGGRAAVHAPDGDRRAARCPATSTCGRSCSTTAARRRPCPAG